MKTKWPIYLSRLTMFGLIIGGLWWLYNKYASVEVVQVQTEKSLPLLVSIFIGTVVMVLASGIATQLLFMWGDYIKKHWFSFQAFAPFLLIILGLTAFIKLSIHKLIILINFNVAQFVNDLQGYNNTMTGLLWWFSGALGFGLAGFAYEEWLKYKSAHA